MNKGKWRETRACRLRCFVTTALDAYKKVKAPHLKKKKKEEKKNLAETVKGYYRVECFANGRSSFCGIHKGGNNWRERNVEGVFRFGKLFQLLFGRKVEQAAQQAMMAVGNCSEEQGCARLTGHVEIRR